MPHSSWVLLLLALCPLAALQERSHRHVARLGDVVNEDPLYAHYDAASAQVCLNGWKIHETDSNISVCQIDWNHVCVKDVLCVYDCGV